MDAANSAAAKIFFMVWLLPSRDQTKPEPSRSSREKRRTEEALARMAGS
jgi:hypothetical protein